MSRDSGNAPSVNLRGLLLAGPGLLMMASCASAQTRPEVANAAIIATPFTEVTPSPFENKQRRKWGFPIIADLDQDGYRDLLLNDHGWAVQVYWNNKGRLSGPRDLVMGDMHGMAVADYDGDGLLEVAISRGGGSGANLRNAKLYRFGRDRSITEVDQGEQPLIGQRGRTAKWFDGDQDGDLDLLLFAFPRNDQPEHGENALYESHGGGRLTLHSYLPKTFVNDDHTLVTDFNGDGDPDLVRYGSNALTLLRGGAGLAFTDASAALPGKYDDVRSVVEFDYDNDGDMDLYLARGGLPGNREFWYDAANKRLGFYLGRGLHQLPPLKLGDTLELRAFQSQYPHHEIWVAEGPYQYIHEGEGHSTRDVTIRNSDALGVPDTHANKGLHFGYIGNDEWSFRIDSHPHTSGVILGVPAFDVQTPHAPPLRDVLLRNDGGRFVDATADAGLDRMAHTMSVAAADFDNDGRMDLLLTNRGNPVMREDPTLMRNLGNGRFEAVRVTGISPDELGAFGWAADAIDYDNDGWSDIVLGNERGLWRLYRNQWSRDSRNGALTVHVGRSPSGAASAQGALVQVQACGLSQMRRVGSTGAPQGQTFDDRLLFGLGQCSEQATVNITWGNGETASFAGKAGAEVAT